MIDILLPSIVLIGILAIGAMLLLIRFGLKTNIVKLLTWLIIFLIFIIIYTFRFEFQNLKNRILANLIPHYSWVNDKGEIVILRNRDGHFYIDILINDIQIPFMIDTGASGVMLTTKAARMLKINPSNLKYNNIAYTANGPTKTASVLLDVVRINNVVFNDVPASVASNDQSDVSLLGMRLISKFSMKIENDLLILTRLNL